MEDTFAFEIYQKVKLVFAVVVKFNLEENVFWRLQLFYYQ